MNKNTKRIARKILQQLQYERGTNADERSIAYSECAINGNEQQLFLLRDARKMQSALVRDIHGAVIGTQDSRASSIYTHSNSVFRDAPVGRAIITGGLGSSEIVTGDGRKINTLVHSFGQYNNSDNYQGDAIFGKIEASEEKAFSFSSLYEALQELDKLEQEVAERTDELNQLDQDLEAAKKLNEEIEAKKQRISALGKRIKQYIASEVALRDQPILDKYQEAVKRSQPLKGSIIINGGPGTGKTTSLIQRISYLAAPTIVEEVGKLSKRKADLLFDEKKAWVFFSPSELLRDYLRNTMQAEGLPASDEQVLTWKQHRSRLIRNMELINPDKQGPFIYRRKMDDKDYFKPGAKALLEIDELFLDWYLAIHKKSIQQIHDEKVLNKLGKQLGFPPADAQREKLLKLAIDIQDATRRALDFSKWEDWISFYIRINEDFSATYKAFQADLNDALNSAASLAQVQLKKDEALYAWLTDLIRKEWEAKSIEEEKDEEDDDSDDLLEEETERDATIAIHNKLKSLLRQLAIRTIDASNNQLSSKNRILNERLGHLYNEDKLKELGIQRYFQKHFASPLRGFDSRVLRTIVPAYKSFRRSILKGEKDCLTEAGITACENALKEGNKILYANEADYLISFIFQWVKALYQKEIKYYEESMHPFISTYREQARAVVAIDEATDFSPLELRSMERMSHPLFNCVTLSGDLMQRMTRTGLSNWQEYTKLYPKTPIYDLKIAYRQTERLLRIAAEIYSWNVAEKAEFVSHRERDERDPSPLVYYSHDEEDKLEWLVQRILEIQRAYGRHFPTLAVFVENDNEAFRLRDLLLESDELEGAGLNVVACAQGQVLGDKRSIRIFSIDYIKGLEFGAAFFWNLDRLSSSNDELFNKYMYVGLSRANLFLGVILDDPFTDDLDYLRDLFEEGQWDLGVGEN